MSTAIALNPPAIRRRPKRSDPFVLRSRTLRPGITLQDTSRYSDDVWQLKHATLKQHERAYILNFPVLPERFRPAAKRIFYRLLTAEPPDGEGEDPIGIHSLRTLFGDIKALILWLDKRWPPDRVCLGELAPRDLEDYNRHLLATYPNAVGPRGRHRSSVRILWRWRTRLDEEALRFDPLRIEGWSQSKPRVSENLTDRLPEPVLGPLIGWALRFIDEFSVDILRADQQWRHTRLGSITDKPHAGFTEGQGRPGEVEVRMRRMLGEHVARNRPLPGYEGRPNIAHIARTLDCNRKSVDSYRHLIEEAAAVVGVAPVSYFDFEISGQLGAEPWLDHVVSGHMHPMSLARLARHLQAAAYIVIAFLSGMRDSEVKHLRRGCLDVHRDEDGNPYRWKVRSLAFKGERDTAGVPATWVVGEPVARAIKMMEDLHPPHVDYLFTRLGHGPGALNSTFAAMTSGATNDQLNRFVTWINDYCADKGRSDAIPKVNKMVFHLKTSAFRRTLAWFVARRPGGVIAGALQYRHHSIQMFEGYAKARELHQTGDKPQVASSWRGPDGLQRYYEAAS